MSEVEKLAERIYTGWVFEHGFPNGLPTWAELPDKPQKQIAASLDCKQTWLGMAEVVLTDHALIPTEEVERYRWRDIESAPKDGTKILVSGGQWISDSNGWPVDDPRPCDEPEIVAYNSLGLKPFCWRGPNDEAHDEYYWHSPTHWMPLPTQPTQIEEEG